MKKIILLSMSFVYCYFNGTNASSLQEIELRFETKEKEQEKYTNLDQAQIDQINCLCASGINSIDANGRTPLYLAVQYNKIEKVKELLGAKDLDINKADLDGLTPLAIAIDEGNKDIINLLLNFGCNNKEINKSEFIDSKDNKIGFTPLMRAVRIGNKDIIKALLDFGAYPTAISQCGKTAIDLTEEKDILEMLESKKKEFTERSINFIRALRDDGDYAKVKAKELLEQGIDVNANFAGETPLIEAVSEEQEEIVKKLIKLGSNVNFKNNVNSSALTYSINYNFDNISQILLEAKAQFDGCLSFELVKKTSKRLLQMLIDAKASVNAYKHNIFPLGAAAYLGKKDLVEILLNSKAELNSKNSFGNTPLSDAVGHEHIDVVKMLVAAKADLNTRNNEGKSALYCASANIRYSKGRPDHDKCKEIYSILLKAGAKKDSCLREWADCCPCFWWCVNCEK